MEAKVICPRRMDEAVRQDGGLTLNSFKKTLSN
jgi:hypothetical protein